MNTEPEYMTNAEGHLVPSALVKPQDKLTNQLVMSLLGTATSMRDAIKAFKNLAFNDVDALLNLLAEKYGAKMGGKKGNVTITSFDGKFKVEVSINDFIQFGPELQIAKSLIDECIHEWSGGANDNIKALIFDAFKVDKNNRLNADRILGLRRLNITDDKWKSAMDAITDSIRVSKSKRYIRFYHRPTAESDWEAIKLDIAGV
ncbi:DUF3164 family protein [Micavibrio aeruginosavorus]|uniref:DUF3164 family protein n=1 Tax=Micavibrio aeruginosavorus TaxID=349221 RepID=UPI003F4AC378